MKKSVLFITLIFAVIMFVGSLFLSSMAFANNIGCWATGAGHIGDDLNGGGISDQPGAGNANQDSFGGAVMGMLNGTVVGKWQDTTHLADKHIFNGTPNQLYCWYDGGPGPDAPRADFNRAVFLGPGKWDNVSGYVFIVSLVDYKEGEDGQDAAYRDAYAIAIYKDTNGDGLPSSADLLVYEETDCVFGNIQIQLGNRGHPYVPFDPSTIPEVARVVDNQDLCPNSNW